ncbi:hypothetical protein ACFYUV_09655 [Nonomuraea sp. NPDC003560]
MSQTVVHGAACPVAVVHGL